MHVQMDAQLQSDMAEITGASLSKPGNLILLCASTNHQRQPTHRQYKLTDMDSG